MITNLGLDLVRKLVSFLPEVVVVVRDVVQVPVELGQYALGSAEHLRQLKVNKRELRGGHVYDFARSYT